MRFARAAAVLASASTFGCALPSGMARSPYTVITSERERAVPEPRISQEEWTLARRRLASLRSVLPKHPYVERVRIGVVDPRTGKLFQGRGALAVSPATAARLVLLGPGGTTALDVWVTPERFRFAIPGLDLERRGGKSPAEAKGLPVGLLRWWFLAPLSGRLVLARSDRSEAAFVLRDGNATVTIRTDGRRFFAMRREGGRLEGLEWSGHGVRPEGGAHGAYIDGTWGTRVHVVVEAVLPDAPDPEAFTDPGEKEQNL